MKDWRQITTGLVGILGFLGLLFLYLFTDKIDLAVFGALLAALVAVITLVSTQLTSRAQNNILNSQSNALRAIEGALNAKPNLAVEFANGESEVDLAAD